MATNSWVITARLVTDSDLHVGSVGGHESADDAVARDGAGRVVIPGTSIGGVLRTTIDLPPDELRFWFGPEPYERGAGEPTEASRVWVSDAHASADAVSLATRTQVGIDRFTGAAHPGVLYTSEVVAPGTTFDVEVRIEPRGGEQVDTDGVATAVVAALRSLAVGGKTGSGRGRLRALEVSAKGADRTTRAGIVQTLRRAVPVDTTVSSAQAQDAGAYEVRFTIPWRPDGPVMVTERWSDHDADRAPITTVRPDGSGVVQPCFVLPGTSVRGPLRAHAERICRTLLGVRADRESFLDQLRVDGFEPLIHLFGAADDSGADRRRGAIRVADVRSAPFDAKLWQCVVDAAKKGEGRATAPSAATKAVDAFNAQTHPSSGLWLDLLARNAIDRWTGGTKNQVLFGALEVHGTRDDSWTPFEVSFRTTKTDAVPEAQRTELQERDLASLALLTVALRDFVAGWIGIGHGTTRGAGAITVSEKAVQVHIGSQVRLGAREPVEQTLPWTAWGELVASHGGQRAWDAALEAHTTTEENEA